MTVSGARSDVEQMKEIPGVKSCEITREISEEVMESDDDETPGTDTEQITLQSEEKTTEADNSETQRVDAEETTQSETDVSERKPEETSAQKTEKQNGEYHLSILAKENQDIREAVFRYCVAHELVLLELKVNTKTLEDVFLELTGSEEVLKHESSIKKRAEGYFTSVIGWIFLAAFLRI